MFDSKGKSSNVSYYPPPELLYTPDTEECMDDCDYEKTVLFLSLSDRAARWHSLYYGSFLKKTWHH